MDIAAKREMIKKITDEVGVFHPLLESILPKIPGICSYEYTHGIHERGADFVLERTDAGIGRKTYIGVVAKAAKITANTSDVEEQILECAEERKYNVVNRVKCIEVWVFCAQGYSERAKEKIISRFAERSIQFFGPEDLVMFVDDHNPYFWFDLPYHLGTYFQSLTRKLQQLDESTEIVQFSGGAPIDIELDTFERTEKSYRDRQHSKSGVREVSFLHEAKLAQLSVLEAEMGFGKSRLARRLAQSMCTVDAYKKDHLIPVYSSFRYFVDHCRGDLDELIHASLGESSVALDDPEVSIVCILDGLDEVNGDSENSKHWFHKVADAVKTKRNIRLVITTRPIRSLEQTLLLTKEARSFGIRQLSLTKIVKYLEKVCTTANLPARLYEDLKRSPLFRQLPKSPIAAALFSNLLSQNQQEVPQSLTELYSKSLDLMLGRWEQKKQLATEKQFQTAELVAERLAEFFIDNQIIYMSEREAVGHVRHYFEKRSLGVNQTEILSLLFDRSNIFSKDAEFGTISFRHRSFAEFLCAKRKYREHSFDFTQVALNPTWTNVMFFYSGLRLDCTNLLATLQQLVPKNESEEWMKILAVPSYLLAAYQTEFSVVEENAHRVLLDAARLYLRIRRGDAAPQLARLSEMHLLYLFKLLVVEGFAYKYFENAFDAIVVYIQESECNDETKHYALFFLGCAALSLGNQSVFQYIVRDVPIEKLPMPIAIAIRAELEMHTNLDKSALLRSHRARLQKLFSPNGSHKKMTRLGIRSNMIKDMFEKPLRDRQTKFAENAGVIEPKRVR